MYTFVIGLIIFACVLLVLVVLAQNAKGGGLSSQFGGSGASNIIGVKKTGDLLEKITWTIIAAIIILSLSTNFISTSQNTGSDGILERAGEQAAPGQLDLDLPVEEEGTSAPTDTLP